MENPKIRIESDGHFAEVYLNGEKVRCTSLDFHGDVVDGSIHFKWDGVTQKLNENGEPYADENGKIAVEEFHYDSRKAVTK